MINNKLSRESLIKPIIIVNIYLLLTIGLFYLGPIKWRTNSPIILLMLLVLYQVLFTLGYLLGYKTRRKNTIKPIHLNLKMKRFLLISILISILLNLLYVYQQNGISISTFLSNLQYSISNAGDLYQKKLTVESESGVLTSIMTVLSPVTFCAIPASIYYWNCINFRLRILSIICIIVEISKWLFIGTNKGIIDIIIIVVSSIVLRRLGSNMNFRLRNFLSNSRATFFLIIILLVGLFSFFNTMSSRVGSSLTPIYAVIGGNTIDLNNWFIKLFPGSVSLFPILIDTYLTQGYYGFNLILNLSFKPLFGIGNSYFLMQKFKAFFGIDVFQFTFIDRIIGWDPLVNWHTAYSWWANDVSVYGVFFVMLLLGFYFFRVIYSAKIDNNFFATMLFPLLFQMIFYLPINNQILSQPLSFMPFIVYSLIFFAQTIIKNWRSHE